MNDRGWPFAELERVGVDVLDCEHKTPPSSNVGYPYIAIPDIVAGRIDLAKVRRITQSDLAAWTRRTVPRAGDVILTRRARVGDTAFVPEGLRCAIGQNLVILRADGRHVDQSFLRWATRGARWHEEVRRLHNVGAVFDSLNVRDVPKLRIPVPPLSEQRAIAEVLGALDDKIEANARVVDAIDGLVRVEVAAALTDTQREASLGDLLQRVSEIAKPHELDQMSLYVGLEHMPRGSLFLKSWGSGEALASAKARFRPGDILFGRLRPYFKKVAVAPSLGVCSTDVLVLRPKVEEQAAFATVVCASDEVVDYASRGSEGTRMPRVSWDYLSRFRVPLPADADLVGLDRRIAPLLHLGIHLPLESIALARLRDTLLPKLVSGELGVRDAESLVKAVV